jgi:hypothetical protein
LAWKPMKPVPLPFIPISIILCGCLRGPSSPYFTLLLVIQSTYPNWSVFGSSFLLLSNQNIYLFFSSSIWITLIFPDLSPFLPIAVSPSLFLSQSQLSPLSTPSPPSCSLSPYLTLSLVCRFLKVVSFCSTASIESHPVSHLCNHWSTLPTFHSPLSHYRSVRWRAPPSLAHLPPSLLLPWVWDLIDGGTGMRRKGLQITSPHLFIHSLLSPFLFLFFDQSLPSLLSDLCPVNVGDDSDRTTCTLLSRLWNGRTKI